MTALQLAREECANYQPNGSCLGAMINEDLSITRSDPKPRCLVAEKKRCPYFEECVSPMANIVSDPRRATAIQEAVAEYRDFTNQKAAVSRPCPDCGGACQSRKRYCPNCAQKRRRSTFRKADQTRRSPAGMSCQQLSQKTDQKPQ